MMYHLTVSKSFKTLKMNAHTDRLADTQMGR